MFPKLFEALNMIDAIFSYTASLLKFFNVNNNSSIEKSFLKFKTKFRFTESKEALRPILFRGGKFKRGN